MQGSGKPKKQHVTPSIDLGSPVKRAWVLVQWHDLHLGDLVTDHGTDEEEVFAFVEIDA
jgi:hypothetical protein